MKIGRRIYEMHSVQGDFSEAEKLPNLIKTRILNVFWFDLYNQIRDNIRYPIIHGCNTHTYIQ